MVYTQQVQVGQSGNDSHQVATSATATSTVALTSPPPAAVATPPPPSGGEKPANDVFAGAMARAASQSTIHPLDTMKVRMQAGSSSFGMGLVFWGGVHGVLHGVLHGVHMCTLTR